MEGEGEAVEGQGGVRVSPRQSGRKSPQGKAKQNKVSHASNFCSVVSLTKSTCVISFGSFHSPGREVWSPSFHPRGSRGTVAGVACNP